MMQFNRECIRHRGDINKMESLDILDRKPENQLSEIAVTPDLVICVRINEFDCVYEIYPKVKVAAGYDPEGNTIFHEEWALYFMPDYVKRIEEAIKSFPDKEDMAQLTETYDKTLDDAGRLIARMVLLITQDKPDNDSRHITFPTPIYHDGHSYTKIEVTPFSVERFTISNEDGYSSSNNLKDMAVYNKIFELLTEIGRAKGLV